MRPERPGLESGSCRTGTAGSSEEEVSIGGASVALRSSGPDGSATMGAVAGADGGGALDSIEVNRAGCAAASAGGAWFKTSVGKMLSALIRSDADGFSGCR